MHKFRFICKYGSKKVINSMFENFSPSFKDIMMARYSRLSEDLFKIFSTHEDANVRVHLCLNENISIDQLSFMMKDESNLVSSQARLSFNSIILTRVLN